MSWLSKAVKKFERSVSAIVPHEHAAQAREREAQMAEMAERKKDYEKQAKDLAEKKEVAEYDKREAGKRATASFKKLRSGGTGLSSGDMSVSNTLG